jgi:hypothetical protein
MFAKDAGRERTMLRPKSIRLTRVTNSIEGGSHKMTYETPEVAVLGSAVNAIQSDKKSVGEPTLQDPRTAGDTELAD